MTWYFQDKVFSEKDIGAAVGFVYEIKCLETGKSYIGQKKFFKKIIRQPLKGKKHRRHSVAPSNWHGYYGSSGDLNADVESLGKEAFRREILWLCFSKGEMNYKELREQMVRDVLLHPDKYYNQYCGSRIHRCHVFVSKIFSEKNQK